MAAAAAASARSALEMGRTEELGRTLEVLVGSGGGGGGAQNVARLGISYAPAAEGIAFSAVGVGRGGVVVRRTVLNLAINL